ncbi:MAG: hypothetical protein SPK50_06505 [Mobiluncus porci]|uniref:hypothetical protein n=1 Tax=Mobiluncus TaxID=2050 RepID=UPI0023F360BC|nr:MULTISPECIES: hypothetical protein [Mobiluncus]MCI6585201.1 hypothetical protein [Mobiluncus sp.]MDD7540639.1 hypothetical protein [Mobiluncus porci]MDY5748764.1 hypothetical protein [Mobiluncus porci]
MGRFIRRVPCKNGGISIQVMEKDEYRRNRVVAHVGTGRSDVEIELLMAKAREIEAS